jgi:hypothetical protein
MMKNRPNVPVVVGTPQTVDLNRRANRGASQRRDDQRRPEADQSAALEGEIGTDHVDAGMGKVENAHHRKDQRQPARQHEQQHAVNKAVQQ